VCSLLKQLQTDDLDEITEGLNDGSIAAIEGIHFFSGNALVSSKGVDG